METKPRRRRWFWRVVILGPPVLFGLWISALVFAPHVSPVPPRPEVVPWRGASAYWNWKGSGGLAWQWCETTPGGVVEWAAFDDGKAVRVSLIAHGRCEARGPAYGGGDVTLWDRADHRDTLYYRGVDPGDVWRGGGTPCGFTVAPERLSALRRIAAEAQARTRNSRRVEHLATLIQGIDETQGDALIASGDGSVCTSEQE